MRTASTTRHDDVPRALLTRIATGGFLAAALHAAIEFGVAERLADGSRSVRELADACKADEDVLYRVLRALASIGVFNEEFPRIFSLTRAAGLLRSRSISDQLRWISHPMQLGAASRILEAAGAGAGASATPRAGLFEQLASSGDLLDCFHRAMAASTNDVAQAVLEAYDFADAALIVDVGGGLGQMLCPILQRHQQVRGILFDRPEVASQAAAYLSAAHVEDRCTVSTGDFFDSLPAGGGLYLLKHVLHDWDDEHAVRILGCVRRRLDGASRAIIVESLLSPGNRPDVAKIGDLAMLLTVGGRERTLEEYAALCHAAGLRIARNIATAAGVSLIEAVLDDGPILGLSDDRLDEINGRLDA